MKVELVLKAGRTASHQNSSLMKLIYSSAASRTLVLCEYPFSRPLPCTVSLRPRLSHSTTACPIRSSHFQVWHSRSIRAKTKSGAVVNEARSAASGATRNEDAMAGVINKRLAVPAHRFTCPVLSSLFKTCRQSKAKSARTSGKKSNAGAKARSMWDETSLPLGGARSAYQTNAKGSLCAYFCAKRTRPMKDF